MAQTAQIAANTNPRNDLKNAVFAMKNALPCPDASNKCI
jgi:hypothetical protein